MSDDLKNLRQLQHNKYLLHKEDEKNKENIDLLSNLFGSIKFYQFCPPCVPLALPGSRGPVGPPGAFLLDCSLKLLPSGPEG